MDTTMTYALAALMAVVGAGFIYIIVRPNEKPVPQGLVQWAGTGMSLLLIILGVALGVFTYQVDARRAGPLGVPAAGATETNQPAENFTFTRLDDGTETDLDDYRGQVVLLNFWATWCPPCLSELPALNRLHETYADDGLVVITISDEDPATIQDFAEEEIALQTVSGHIQNPEALPEPFVRMLAGRPMSYIIDRGGTVRHIILGERDYDGFEAMVRPLLESNLTVR